MSKLSPSVKICLSGVSVNLDPDLADYRFNRQMVLILDGFTAFFVFILKIWDVAYVLNLLDDVVSDVHGFEFRFCLFSLSLSLF